MFDFDTLQEEFGTGANTTDTNGETTRVATSEDIINALLGESVNYVKGMQLKDTTPLSSVISVELATQAVEVDCFGEFIKSKLGKIAAEVEAAKSGTDKDRANAEAKVQGMLQFLRRVQSNAGRSSYFRHQAALRQETAGADRKSYNNDYDGWQNLRLEPSMVEEAVDELFEDIMKAYSFCLSLGGQWVRTKMALLPFFSTRVGDAFEEFESRLDGWKYLESNRPTAASAKDVLASI